MGSIVAQHVWLAPHLRPTFELFLSMSLARLFMMEWKFRDGASPDAYKRFLKTGAPFPGVTKFDRYHAANGSGNGWIVAETDDLTHIYAHCAEWNNYLEWKVTPLMGDEAAGGTAAKAMELLEAE